MKAAVYIRVSTEEQTEYSPKSQQEMIARYAAERGIELTGEFTYIDEGISGRTAKGRPAFQRMLSDARRKPRPFDLVLVWKFSRFARNRKDSIVCKAMLKQYGIEVISVSEPLGSDSTSVLMEALLEAMDEYYSLNLAQEVKRGMEQKFREGGVVSRPPFGYRMREGAFSPVPNEAQAVEIAFEAALAGRPLRAIADLLAAQGVCRSDGSLLTPRAIRYLLQNPIYCGRAGRTLDGKWVVLPANQPPIVTPELFDSVQQRFGRSIRSYEKQQAQEWMLRGVIMCSDCGAPLARAGKGSLQCSGYAKGKCRVSHWVAEQALNDALQNALYQLPMDLPVYVRISDHKKSHRKDSTEEALLRAERAYLAGITDLDEYAAQKNKILTLQKSSEGAEIQPFMLDGRFMATFLAADCFTEAEKRQLIQVLFKQAVFDRKRGTLTLVWREM